MKEEKEKAKEPMDIVMNDEQLIGIGAITPDWTERRKAKVNVKTLKNALDIFIKMDKKIVEVAVGNDKTLLLGESKPNGKFAGIAIAQAIE